MIIDVSSILKEYGGKIEIDGSLTMPDSDFLGELYTFNEPVKIVGSISNNGKSLILKANVKGSLNTRCARCTKEIDVPIEFCIDENLAQDDGTISDDGEIILFEGYTIDILDIALNSFLINVSGKYLCSEDCKGLCPKCGTDLNEGECGCNRESIDPRWASLMDIMQDNE